MNTTPLAQWGGRKFILALVCCIAATVLQFFGKIDAAGNTYAWVIIGVCAAFVTGNTAPKVWPPATPKTPIPTE